MEQRMSHTLLHTEVKAEWVDFNGHLNDAEYVRVFSRGADGLMDLIGLDAAGRAAHQCTLYTLEMHTCYLAEVLLGEPLRVDLDILDQDIKRIHVFFSMYKGDGALIATSEQLFMAVSTASKRSTNLPDAVCRELEALGQLSAEAWPVQAGRRVGIRRRAKPRP